MVILAPLALFFIARLAINVASRNAAAIFLDGDVLQLISGTVRQIPWREIETIDLRKGGLFPFQFIYLCFHLRGPGIKKAPTSLFSESPEQVRDRVQAALADLNRVGTCP
jgi:hypothetical protein